MTKRSPIVVLLLVFITCGLYGLFWLYSVRDETRVYLNDEKIKPGLDVFLSIICFPYVVYLNYVIAVDLVRVANKAEVKTTDNSLAVLVVSCLGLAIVSNLILQSQINSIVDSANA